MKYCGNCGNPVPDGDEYCSFCGSKVGMEEPVFAHEYATQTEQSDSLTNHNRFCQNCGSPMEPGDDFCTECGARYGTSSSPAKERVSTKMPKKRKLVYIVMFVVLVILVGAGTILGVVLSEQNPGTSSHDLSSQSSILDQSTSSESVMSGMEPSPSPEASNLKDDSFQDVVDQAISDGDYPTAIHLLEYWQEQEPDDPTISEQLEETRESYQNEVIAQTNSLIQQGDQEGAVSLLTEAKEILGNSQEIDLVLNALEINKVSVNSSNAVDKREQPPRKDGCSLFHVNAGLRRKKMERRLQEKQIPIGLLSKQVVLQVEEAAQFSGGGIRYKVKESVSEDALVLKDVQVCKRDSRKLVRHSGSTISYKRLKSTALSIFRSRCSFGTRLSIPTISTTSRSIFPRFSIFLTTTSIISYTCEKAQLSLDFFDRLDYITIKETGVKYFFLTSQFFVMFFTHSPVAVTS